MVAVTLSYFKRRCSNLHSIKPKDMLNGVEIHEMPAVKFVRDTSTRDKVKSSVRVRDTS